MTQPAKPNNLYKIAKILNIQLIFITILTLIVYILFSKNAAQAFIIGSLIAWLGNYIVAKFTFKLSNARNGNLIVKNMYRGIAIKWAITISLLCIVLINYKTVNTLFLFLGFITSQLNNWMFIIKNNT